MLEWLKSAAENYRKIELTKLNRLRCSMEIHLVSILFLAGDDSVSVDCSTD